MIRKQQQTRSHPGDGVIDLDRRAALKAGLAAGGALMVGFSFGRAEAASSFQPNAFIRIDRDSSVTVLLPKCEMGQGINTSIPMLLAEELDAPLAQVRVVFAAAGESGDISQITGGSTTTRTTVKPLQEAAAKARAMLVEAASKRWAVAPQSCTTNACAVLHVSTGQRVSYGDLIEVAAKLPVPDKAVCKAVADYTLVGKPQTRLDAVSKSNGTAVFGIDAAPPRMKVAAIAACPVFGGKLRSVDPAPALAIKNVVKVVSLPDAVAVIADHTGAARAGLAALKIDWDLGPNAQVNQDDIVAAMRKASDSPGAVSKQVGDAKVAIAGAPKRIEAVYQMPFLAHAPMEPINCTASVSSTQCEVWIGTQAPPSVKAAAAKASGLPADKVIVHNHLMGGGFGRKVEIDMVDQAVRVAKTVDYPVKLIWSREEDIQHDFYRPYYLDRMEAGLGADGKPAGWTHRIVASSVMARFFPPSLAATKGVDLDAIEGSETPYTLPNMTVDYVRQESAVPTGFWRGVGATHNIFVVESFIDECAHAAGADPVAYRQALLSAPRAKAVLALAAEKAGWGSPLPAGWGRGVSVQHSWDTLMSQIVEVEVTPAGQIKVHRVVCAVDCGQMINPQTVRAQVEGGILFGLTAALQGEITIRDGRVEQTNFGDYPPLRLRDAPAIDVHLVENHEVSGGMGEPPTAGIGPALANAVFAATAVRVRQLPLSRTSLKKA
jgi:isoquinoline 1-oxidoreductase beta subunit